MTAKKRRRKDGTFLPEGDRAKPKPPTCTCRAYRFPHAKGKGACSK
jgi:hypothetical protein